MRAATTNLGDMRRLSAAVATAAAALGALGLLAAAGGSDVFRYVSESGVTGAPHAGLYRASIWLVAVALALLAPPARATLRLAVPALALAAPFAAVSGAVTCSPGCPLPPFEQPTAGDLVHAGASIAALLLCALVMVLYAVQPVDPPLRRAGRAGLTIAVPLLALSAVGLLFVGRGPLTGVVERASLVATSAWLIATAALHVRRSSVDRS